MGKRGDERDRDRGPPHQRNGKLTSTEKMKMQIATATSRSTVLAFHPLSVFPPLGRGGTCISQASKGSRPEQHLVEGKQGHGCEAQNDWPACSPYRRRKPGLLLLMWLGYWQVNTSHMCMNQVFTLWLDNDSNCDVNPLYSVFHAALVEWTTSLLLEMRLDLKDVPATSDLRCAKYFFRPFYLELVADVKCAITPDLLQILIVHVWAQLM